MSENNQLITIGKESGLPEQEITSLLGNFNKPYNEASEIAKQAKDIMVTDENQTELMGQARIARLKLKKIRGEVETQRKKLKEDSLRKGKAIDGMANIIKALIIPVEERLEQQEKFAEMKAEARKAERHAERIQRISQFVANASVYSLEDMTDEEFEELLTERRDAYTARVRAEAEEEKARLDKVIAEKKQQEEERAESERLRKEAEYKRFIAEKTLNRVILLNRAGVSFDEEIGYVIGNENIIADDNAISKLNDVLFTQLLSKVKKITATITEEKRLLEEKHNAELEQERKEQAEYLAKERSLAEEERKRREALEADHMAREKLERERQEAEEAKKHQALIAPDKEKLSALADVIDSIDMPHVSNREAIAVLNETIDFLNRISKNLRNKAKDL